jgi:hypothetical protein
MHPRQQALLARILASPQFAQTLTLGKILAYLCEHTVDTENSIKEYEIATQVLHRDQSFDPKLDPVVRVSMKGIRDRLQRYFDDAGEHETLRLAIPKGQYRAEFIESGPASDANWQDSAGVLKCFWAPYFAQKVTNLLVYTEPLFFREGWETYVRNLYCNDPENGYRQLIGRLPELRSRDLRPSFHYLDTGEVRSMFLLMQFLHELGAPVGIRNGRIASWNELRSCNLVLVGCTRTSPFIDMLQEERDFVVSEDEIRNLSPREAELPSYRGERYYDARLPRCREYALITRRPGASQNSTVTMIAANHGRAIEGAANYLITSREISKLLSTLNVDRFSALPKRFQILLRIEMIDMDDEIVDVEYVSHRLIME